MKSLGDYAANTDKDLQIPMHHLHLGLPHGGGDDHRSVGAEREAVQVRDVLLRAEELSAMRGGGNVEGAGAQEHDLGGGGLG